MDPMNRPDLRMSRPDLANPSSSRDFYEAHRPLGDPPWEATTGEARRGWIAAFNQYARAERAIDALAEVVESHERTEIATNRGRLALSTLRSY